MDKNLNKVCVVGLGKVGYPLYTTLQRWLSVRGFDRNMERNYDRLTLRGAIWGADAVIIMVPTPSNEDGSFSNTFVLTALEAIRQELEVCSMTNLLYVISSTVVPGSCEKFKKIVGSNLVYNPLFIRLQNVAHDLLNPSAILIGADSAEIAERCASIWRYVNAPIVTMSLVEAELAKITLNCALTMKISLANQLHLVASKLGADSKKIMDFIGLDPRINPRYLEPGRPYGGPCLPRDNRMFQYVAERVGVHAALSCGADIINDLIKEKR